MHAPTFRPHALRRSLVFRAAAAWARLRAWLEGEPGQGFAPDPTAWRVIVALAIALAALAVGLADWGPR